jgi:hypothetical protein
MYGEALGGEYLKVSTIRADWARVLEKYNINWIIYNAGAPLSTFLLEKKDWRLVYADRVTYIFVKNTPENRFLIEKYPDVKPVEPTKRK